MFQTNKSELMKKVFTGLSGFNEDVTFRINQDHIWFSTMTKDNTSMIIVKIPSAIFQKYEFDKTRDVKVNSNIIKKVLSGSGKDDILYISFDETWSQIKITLSSTKIKKSYDITLTNITDEDGFKTKEPELSHDVMVNCKNKEIIEMLDSLVFSGMKGYGDSITIMGSSNGLSIKEETKYGNTTLTLKDFDKEGFVSKSSCKVSYILFKPLVTFIDSILMSSNYSLKKDYPIKVTGKNEEVEITFILAPRVENED